MANKKTWFRHPSNAGRDSAMLKLTLEHGHFGKGIYWDIVEIMSEQKDKCIDFSVISMDMLAGMIGANIERMRLILRFCRDEGLFETEGQKIWSIYVPRVKEKKTGPAKEWAADHPVKKLIKEQFKTVAKLDEPTAAQMEKLQSEYSMDEINRVLEAMENKKDLLSKYVSAYLTMNNWLRLERLRASRIPENKKTTMSGPFRNEATNFGKEK